MTCLDLLFDLEDRNPSFLIVSEHSQEENITELTIEKNMLSLAFAKRIFDKYNKLFTSILGNDNITSLLIQMEGRLPVIMGALGAAEKSSRSRTYGLLALRFKGATTYGHGKSPCWGVYGDPAIHIMWYAQATGDEGSLLMSFPPEIWAVQEWRDEILQRRDECQTGGVRQIEFGNRAQEVLVNYGQGWRAFDYNHFEQRHQP